MRSEAAGRRKSDIAQQYLDIVGVIMLACNTEAKITMLNQKGCELLGCDPKKIIGRNWFDQFVPARMRAEVRSAFDQLIAGDIAEFENYENPIVSKGGEERIIAWHNTLIKDHEGNITGTLSSGEDITERRKFELALKESEEKFRMLVEKAGDGIEITQNDQIIYTNPHFAEMLGYSVEELSELPFRKFFTEQATTDLYDREKRRKGGEQLPDQYETTFQKKDGSTIDVDIKYEIIQYDGAPATIAIIRDITEHKESEAEVKKLSEVVEHSSHHIVITDPQGAIEYVNPAFVKQTGYSLEEVLGKNPRILQSGDTPSEIYEELWNTILSSNTWRGEFKNKRKDGSIYWESAFITPSVDKDGKITHIVATKQDITEQKNAELKLKNSEERLKDAHRIANLGHWELDLQTNSLYWSDQIFRIFEIDPAQFGATYEAFLDAIHPEDRDMVNLAYAESLKSTSQRYSIDHRLLMKDGRIKYVHEEGETSFDPEGSALLSIGTVQDITSKRAAEERAKSLGRIIEDSLNEIYLFDADNLKFIHVNHGALLNLGYSMEEMFELTPLDIKPEVDAKYFHQLTDPLRKTKQKRINFETIHQRKDGSTYPVEVHLQMSTLVEKPIFIAIIMDLTNKHEAEEDYKDLIHTAVDPIIAVNEKSEVVIWNPGAEKVFGYSEKEMLGKTNARIHIDKQNLERQTADISKFIKTGTSYFVGKSYEIPLKKRDGEIIPTLVSTSARKHTDGWLFISFIKNISLTKKQEALSKALLRLVEYSLNHSIKELLQKFLDEAEILSDSNIGFYHFVEEDQSTLFLQTWSTNTLNNMCDADAARTHYPITEAGVWVDCIQERKPVIHNDYSSLTHRKGLPEGHSPIIRELVVPVIRGDKVVAVLGVGNKPNHYNKQDARVVQQMAEMAWEIIERKMIEETLSESEEKFRSIVDNTRIGIATVSSTGKPMFVNESLSRLLGYTAEELQKMSFAEFTHPDDVDLDVENYGSLVKGEIESYALEKRYIHKSGNTVWASLTVSAVRDAEGDILYAVGMVDDISERKVAEMALQESEQKYRMLFTSVPTGWAFHKMILNNEGKPVDYEFLEINEAFEKLTGLKKQDIIGKRVTEVIPDILKDPFDWIDKYGKVAQSGKNLRFNQYFEPFDKWYFVTASCPKTGYFIVTFEDITDQKRSEAAAHEQGEFTQLLMDSAAEGIYGLDMEGNCSFFNNACRQMLGYSEDDDLIGKNMHNLIHYSREDGTLYPVEECYIYQVYQKGKGSHRDDEIFWCKDGSTFYAEYWSYPMYDNDEVIGTVVTFTDISERKTIEKELEQHRNQLEQLVKERTQELETKTKSLEMFNKTMLDREMRMIELKKEVNALSKRLDLEEPYPSIWE